MIPLGKFRMILECTLVLLSFHLTLNQINCQSTSVIFSNPGMFFKLFSGVYGGRVCPSRNGSEVNLYETGFIGGYILDGVLTYGFTTTTQSFDAVSKEVLMSIDRNGDTSKLTLVKGSLCIGKNQLFQHRIIKYAQITTPPGSSGLIRTHVNGIKAVAYYNSQVYLILNAVYGIKSIGDGMMNKVELRSLQGCKSQSQALATIFLYPFNLVGCSRLIATIGSRKYLDYRSSYQSGTDLKLFNVSGIPTFFTVLLNYTRNATKQWEISAVDVLLYMITEKGHKVLLHRQPIKPIYTSAQISQLGGVDYKNGIVCWSTVSQVHCGKLDALKSKLTNVVTVVKEGETQSHGICSVGSFVYDNVTTGVAIAKATASQYSVYFGCFAQMLDKGGAGLVNVRSDGKERHLYKVVNVKSKFKTVLAGGMFRVEDPIKACT